MHWYFFTMLKMFSKKSCNLFLLIFQNDIFVYIFRHNFLIVQVYLTSYFYKYWSISIYTKRQQNSTSLISRSHIHNHYCLIHVRNESIVDETNLIFLTSFFFVWSEFILIYHKLKFYVQILDIIEIWCRIINALLTSNTK